VPFVCGATNLGEALRRITEGAAMIRSKGEAGTGDVSNATTHMRQIRGRDPPAASMDLPEDELYVAAKELQAPYELVKEVAAGRQAAGRALHRRRHRHPGRRRDDDAARRRGRLRRVGHLQVRQPGRSGPRRSSRRRPSTTTRTSSPRSPAGLGEAMVGINVEEIPQPHRLAERGW
jgi:pyridoxal 5'-phosphate synthase pdxS subunit